MIWRLIRGYRSRAAYRRCLANIDRLERELFPEWFAPEEDEFSIAPGARWVVDSPNYVQVMDHKYLLHRALLYGDRAVA